MDEQTVCLSITKVVNGRYELSDDMLAIEEPVQILLTYGANNNRVTRQIAITMRTPGCDQELAAGFLFTEGIISDKSQIADISSPAINKVQVTLVPNFSPRLQQADRNFYTTSSCGVCGKTSIDSIRSVSPFRTGADDLQFPACILNDLEQKLIIRQNVFAKTGGLHSCAVFDTSGTLMDVREDVGRHNALDKLIGNALLNNLLPLSKALLLLSGRASFELIQKASMAGIHVVIAVGAPSSLAVQLAQEMDITLIGFLRADRFNIYSGHERIIFPVTSEI